MKIGIYSGTLHKFGSGIQEYIKHLIVHILDIIGSDKITLIYPLSRFPISATDFKLFSNRIFRIQIPFPERMLLQLWNSIYFPTIDSFYSRQDIIHSVTSFLPPVRKTKTIVTVHDLACIRYPDLLIISNEKRKMIMKSIDKADLIIADSKNTRKDIIELIGIEESRVIVIYPGVDLVFQVKQSKQSIESTLLKYAIDFPYFLFVGNIEPRKNLRRMIQAYDIFTRKSSAREKLLLVGARTYRTEEELSVIADLGLCDRVKYLGYVPRKDMPALYAGASIFLYPSTYEGFGFPVLEAMSCGVPIITSNTSSMPEIGGDAACYVSPKSIESIAEAIMTVHSDCNVRKKMIDKGYVQGKQFSWHSAALQIYDCYKKLVGEK